MKKWISLILAMVLALSLAACGGKSDPPPSSSQGSDAPLTRESSGQSSPPTQTPDGSAAAGAPDVDFGAIMSGNGTSTLISGLSEAERQAFIEAGKEDDYEVSFGADGSTTIEYEDGTTAKQSPDGTWNILDEEGNVGQVGGNWPDNEYTKVIPKPDFVVMAAMQDGDAYTITFGDVTIDQLKEYVEQVKSKGFTVEAETEDQEVMGMVIYMYTAKNADGWEVEVMSASGVCGVNVRKP